MRQCRDSEKNSKQTYKDHKHTETNMQLGGADGPVEKVPKTTSMLDRNKQKECNKGVHARDRNETNTHTAMQIQINPGHLPPGKGMHQCRTSQGRHGQSHEKTYRHRNTHRDGDQTLGE